MKINITMLTLAALLISACSTTPTTTTAPEETGSAAAASTAQPSAPESDAAKVQVPAGSAVSSSELANQLLAIQKKSIYFDFDTFVVRGEYSELIQQQADLMKSHPNVVVTLAGNADERGSPEYNLALGSKRANAVRKSLMILGVAGSQIQTVSFGEEQPQLSCHEEKCWSENRRVDFNFKLGN
jgi:peptidoglycan-associated lipoprotein